jgi:Cu/Ag efflux pump CusA
LSSINELLIETPTGRYVHLHEVADVRVAPAATVINRDAVSRFVDVTADVRGRDPLDVAADVKRGIKQVDFPLEYRAELLGEYAERLIRDQVFAYDCRRHQDLRALQAFFRAGAWQQWSS